jgi:hypothetical protein
MAVFLISSATDAGCADSITHNTSTGTDRISSPHPLEGPDLKKKKYTERKRITERRITARMGAIFLKFSFTLIVSV